MKKKCNLVIYSKNSEKKLRWKEEIGILLGSWFEVHWDHSSSFECESRVALIDGSNSDDTAKWIDSASKDFGGQKHAVYLILEESRQGDGSWLLNGKVDGVLIFPFRPLELLSCAKRGEQHLVLSELNLLNTSVSQLVELLRKDLELAERLQKLKQPKRFEGVQGFLLGQRYLAGLRSGGDYFDLAQSKNQSRLTFVMSNTSSYGLSNSLLSVLMKVTVKLSLDLLERQGTTSDVVSQILQEVLLVTGEKDQFSLLFATLSRSDLLFRFCYFGESCLFYAPPKEDFEVFVPEVGVASKVSEPRNLLESQIQLHPHGRLVLSSWGVVQALGGPKKVQSILNRFRKKEVEDLLNEVTYQIKSQMEEDDLPARDCSVVCFDLLADASSKVRALVKPKQDVRETSEDS